MTLPQLAVVVIGRNEGERLRRCIDTLVQATDNIVYVDSGSTDGSAQMARSRGVHVVDLDMTRPFSAARARNEGFAVLQRDFPSARYVQFVDGDCDVHPDWLSTGVSLLERRPEVVAVFGKLTERHPERSIYNHYASMTWNPPSEGEALYFGGNIMVRVPAVAAIRGFREGIIDSEDHDLAIRLRMNGGTVWYTEAPMAVHDLAVFEFRKFWIRCTRGGYGNGQMVTLHANTPGRPHRKDWNRTWLWGLGVPVASAAGFALVGWPGLLPLGIYPAAFMRMFLRPREQYGRDVVYAGLTVIGRFPEAIGQMKFLVDRMRGREAKIIEYK